MVFQATRLGRAISAARRPGTEGGSVRLRTVLARGHTAMRFIWRRQSSNA